MSDSDSDNLVRLTDDEHGDPATQTPGVQKALEGASHKLRRSSRMKNIVVRYGYNEYMAHHYAYMMKVAWDQELEIYTEAAQDP